MEPSNRILTFFALICLCQVMGAAHAQSDLEYKDRVFQWTAPTECVDGTDISNCPLTEYRLYCDNLSIPYSVPETELSYTAPATDFPVGGPYTCYATALSGQLESDPSNTITFSVVATQSPPAPPSGLTVQNVLTASTIIESPDQIILLPVGTVVAGTACDTRMSVNGQYLVPRDSVDWNTGVEPQMAVFANCE
jgi:hypothetical protein